MPKRRGPDKRPGTRQRRCKKRVADDLNSPNPKRRRTSNTSNTSTDTTETFIDTPQIQPQRMVDSKPTSQSVRHPERPSDPPINSPTLRLSPGAPPSSGSEHLVKVWTSLHYHQRYSISCWQQEASPTHPRPLDYGYEQELLTGQAFSRSIELNTLVNDPQRLIIYSTSQMAEARQRGWWERIFDVCRWVRFSYSDASFIDLGDRDSQELINEFIFLCAKLLFLILFYSHSLGRTILPTGCPSSTLTSSLHRYVTMLNELKCTQHSFWRVLLLRSF